MIQDDSQKRMELWLRGRTNPLIGAVAAHLAGLSDADLRQVPFYCDVMVDLRAVLYNTIDVTSVSLAWREVPDSNVYIKSNSPEHHFCCSFIYALNKFEPSFSDNLAHESPYRFEWRALSRSEKIALLVEHFADYDPAVFMLHELVQAELLDPDEAF